MPPFEGLQDLPQDLVDCVPCFLMTVLRETHLIPHPHLNLFLSGMTVTHTEVQHVNLSQNCSHTVSLLATPAGSLESRPLPLPPHELSSLVYEMNAVSQMRRPLFCYCQPEDWWCVLTVTYRIERRGMSWFLLSPGRCRAPGITVMD